LQLSCARSVEHPPRDELIFCIQGRHARLMG